MTEPMYSSGTSTSSRSMAPAWCRSHRSGTGREGWRPGTQSLPGAWFRLGWKGASRPGRRPGSCRRNRLLHPEGDVLEQLFKQPVTQLARGDELAFPASEGAVVDRKGHLHGGLADFDKGQGETSAKSQMVLPMVMSVMPEKQMMSPILASSQGTRFNPSIWYMAVILPR